MTAAPAVPVPGSHRDTGDWTDAHRGWFPQDAESHRRDVPRYCPACTTPFGLAEDGHGLATEYWVARDRVFACFCGRCGWSGDIVLTERVVGHEAEH